MKLDAIELEVIKSSLEEAARILVWLIESPAYCECSLNVAEREGQDSSGYPVSRAME